MSKRIEVRDLNVYYSDFLAVEGVSHDHRAPQRHRLHRPVGLRQVDVPAHPQPHARGHPGRPRRGRGAARRRRPLRRATSTRSPCAARSAWSSSARTRSRRCRSRRTCSPGVQLNNSAHLQGRRRRPRREVAARREPLERGQGPPRQARLGPVRAASSSACASPAPSRSRPQVLLMDEPCSALDPISTLAIEDLIERAEERLHDRHRDPQHAAGGARSPTRRRSSTSPAPASPASSSSTTTPRRSSPTPPCRPPRTTSPARSGDQAPLSGSVFVSNQGVWPPRIGRLSQIKEPVWPVGPGRPIRHIRHTHDSREPLLFCASKSLI